MAIRAIDTVITFRILKLLTTKWVDQSAYKEGLIDDKGKRIKSEKLIAEKVVNQAEENIKQEIQNLKNQWDLLVVLLNENSIST